jgi:uncharacterized protein
MPASRYVSQVGPVQPHERIEFVDILRGLALLGILVENLFSYSGQAYRLEAYADPLQRAAVAAVKFLLEAKSYSLLAFLFGWGTAVLMRREPHGRPFTFLYLRRLFVLLAFGLLHATCIWFGDILVLYAILGLVLLLFRRRSTKTILIAAGCSLLLSIVLQVPGEGMQAWRAWYASVTDPLRSQAYPESWYVSGSYLQATQRRIQDWVAANSWLPYYVGNVLGMLLLGLFVGKRRLFLHIDRQPGMLRKTLWAGLAVGVPLNLVFVFVQLEPRLVPGVYYDLVRVGARTIGAPALMLFYVSAVALLVQRAAWRRRLAPVASVGRASLSNYLVQSILCTGLFYGYGLGLYGQIGPLLGLVLAVIIYLVQVRISEGWFERYRFGPLEWVWRSVTYGRRLPLRLERNAREFQAQGRPYLAYATVAVVLVLALAAGWSYGSGLSSGGVHERSRLASTSQPTPAQAHPGSAAGAAMAEQGVADGAVAEAVETPVVQPVPHHPSSLAASGDLMGLALTVDVQSAWAEIETLTGDPYWGRYAGSPEGWAAGDYLAERFAQYGLQPAGSDGTFFQPFPVDYVTYADEPRLIIEAPGGLVYDRYVPFQDFSAVLRWYAGEGTAEGSVVWMSDCSFRDFEFEVVDKVVLCRDGDLKSAQRNAIEHGAAGLLLLTDPQSRPPDFGSTYFEPLVPEPLPVFRVYPSVVQDLLMGSGQSVQDLSSLYSPLNLLTQAHLYVDTMGAELCPSMQCQGRNVLGVLPGRDPAYADEIVIIGAHYDHLGQGPAGMVWSGANDNASGVAVLLEIAKSWHEQGYVPRRTVLFAAWDAEEMGLLGSQHYVTQPRYPLKNTVSMIQLDMVGAGGAALHIDGSTDLGAKIREIAELWDVETEMTSLGRSDHVPFLAAGVPADLLIWDLDSPVPHYHRPMDTITIIQRDKLESAARIAALSLLSLVEGEPAIQDLLARRADAVEHGDIDAFLATSTSDLHRWERYWFQDARSLGVSRLELAADQVRILGREATARVRVAVRSVDGSDQEAVRTASLMVRFVHDNHGWLWAGPDLVWEEPALAPVGQSDADTAGFSVAYPPDQAAGVSGLAQAAAKYYAEIAGLLDLPAGINASLVIVPGSDSLRASTAMSLPPDSSEWTGFRIVRITYQKEITSSTKLENALAHLLLSEAGVTQEVAPWLWTGLPLVLRDRLGEGKEEYLEPLWDQLDGEVSIDSDAASWAAVDYLRQQAGWEGLGRFIAALGEACGQDENTATCARPDALDQALAQIRWSSGVLMDSTTFAEAWQSFWRDRIARAQADLEAVLTTRMAAVLAGDEAAFMATVDLEVPNLFAEERRWFRDLDGRSLKLFSLVGRPVALLEDQSLLADVTIEYRLVGQEGRWAKGVVPLRVLLTPGGDGYLWAGVPLASIEGEHVSVLYSIEDHEDREVLADQLLSRADQAYARLAPRLGAGQDSHMIVKLYGSEQAFRTSIALSFPLVDWVPAWSEKDTSIKMRLTNSPDIEALEKTLIRQMIRSFLYARNVDSEWVLKALSLYLAEEEGSLRWPGNVRDLDKMLQAVAKQTAPSLDQMPTDDLLSDEEFRIASAITWNTLQHINLTYGNPALKQFIDDLGDLDVESALLEATGLTLAEFESEWRASVVRAHALPEWIQTAKSFDPDAAYEHIHYLTSPELGGRQAGSPGAQTAANYIAAKFLEYGLVPANLDPVPAYSQYFPISYTMWITAPTLVIVGDQDGMTERLVYRRDFTTLIEPESRGGCAAGELVWIQDSSYGGTALDGKIAVRNFSWTLDAEISEAMEHGAGGLILVSMRKSTQAGLDKIPLPATFAPGPSIPVIELTQQGYAHLLNRAGYAHADIVNAPPIFPLDTSAEMCIPLAVPTTVNAANVLGIMPGSDARLKDQVVILAAHYDYVGDDPAQLNCPPAGSEETRTECQWSEGKRYSGLNDSSGVGVLLEIARLWHQTGFHPQRSVLFAAWGAHSPGELGARYYVDHPIFALDKTAALFELGAVGGGDGYYLEAYGDPEYEALLQFNLRVATEWVDGRLALEGRSDQGVVKLFHQAGTPSIKLEWRGASEENWPDELADQVDPYRVGITGQILTLTAMNVAR